MSPPAARTMHTAHEQRRDLCTEGRSARCHAYAKRAIARLTLAYLVHDRQVEADLDALQIVRPAAMSGRARGE
eukprot:6175241-Pleurochrysis_carterae.AAC.3